MEQIPAALLVWKAPMVCHDTVPRRGSVCHWCPSAAGVAGRRILHQWASLLRHVHMRPVRSVAAAGFPGLWQIWHYMHEPTASSDM
jgi:hypothetical protein